VVSRALSSLKVTFPVQTSLPRNTRSIRLRFCAQRSARRLPACRRKRFRDSHLRVDVDALNSLTVSTWSLGYQILGCF
jgi:hypothetical protein